MSKRVANRKGKPAKHIAGGRWRNKPTKHTDPGYLRTRYVRRRL